MRRVIKTVCPHCGGSGGWSVRLKFDTDELTVEALDVAPGRLLVVHHIRCGLRMDGMLAGESKDMMFIDMDLSTGRYEE